MLFAPNEFIREQVISRYFEKISSCLRVISPETELRVEVASLLKAVAKTGYATNTTGPWPSNLNKELMFDNFVEGKSNQLARAAAIQTAKNLGKAYNPLFICGGVGLGKTHLIHAIGHMVLKKKPDAKILYLTSERFVDGMVRALQKNTINHFKQRHRSLDVLLIDDIQFFAGKERSQEELFHTFNTLVESRSQVVLTCDRYPRELPNLEERLKSRFSWGLTVSVDPPELETRVAILMVKAQQKNLDLPQDVAFFIAKRFHSNVRELEGALNRLLAHVQLTGKKVTLDFAAESLKDLLLLQERQTSIEIIQRTVASYYKVRLSDLTSSNRSRSVTLPRQVAMTLAKELTSHSLPEIGNQFGGRDHTTVMHSRKKITELRKKDVHMEEDYKNLFRILSS